MAKEHISSSRTRHVRAASSSMENKGCVCSQDWICRSSAEPDIAEETPLATRVRGTVYRGGSRRRPLAGVICRSPLCGDRAPGLGNGAIDHPQVPVYDEA